MKQIALPPLPVAPRSPRASHARLVSHPLGRQRREEETTRPVDISAILRGAELGEPPAPHTERLPFVAGHEPYEHEPLTLIRPPLEMPPLCPEPRLVMNGHETAKVIIIRERTNPAWLLAAAALGVAATLAAGAVAQLL